MKFGTKKEKKDEKEEIKNNEEIEIVMGDDSELNISEVGDYMNDLRPKTSNQNKDIVIPKTKKKK